LQNPSTWTASLLELDQRLEFIFRNFHSDFRYTNASSFVSPKLDSHRLFFLHGLYHLCACVLHSSIVPLFSDGTSNNHIPQKVVRLSVRQCLKHSAIVLDMATAFVSNHLDSSRLPSILGYVIFVACAIHFKSFVAQGKPHIDISSYSAAQYAAAVYILKLLKTYWVTLEGLVSSTEPFSAFAIDELSG
jgi:hypothetical protein